jgi:hypothetical protein
VRNFPIEVDDDPIKRCNVQLIPCLRLVQRAICRSEFGNTVRLARDLIPRQYICGFR